MKLKIIILLVFYQMSCIYFVNAQQYKKDSAVVIKLYLKKNNVINADSSDNITAYYLINFMDDSIKTKKLNEIITDEYLTQKEWLKILNNNDWIPFVNSIGVKDYRLKYVSDSLRKIIEEREKRINEKTRMMKQNDYVTFMLDSCNLVRFNVNKSDIIENSIIIYKVKCEGYTDTISKYNLSKLYNKMNKNYIEGIVELLVIPSTIIKKNGEY
jgi:hypothetical protein